MAGNWEAVPLWGGRAGSPSNTMWPGPRPTCVPSFILIRPTVWPQCTNVTERQTGQTGQRTDSIVRTVLQTVAQKLATFETHYNSKMLTVASVVNLVLSHVYHTERPPLFAVRLPRDVACRVGSSALADILVKLETHSRRCFIITERT